MKNPLISILLPTYKNARRIATAIRSVQRQSFDDWELIIIDDGLFSEPLHLIAEFQKIDPRIVCVKNGTNLGIQKSLNGGLRKARGIYIARIDDDDEWIDADKLKRQVSFLEQHPEYVLVGTDAMIADDQDEKLGNYSMPASDDAIRARILSKNCFLHPTIVARMSVVLQAGGYDESDNVRHIEDYALWLRLGIMGKFANISTISVRLIVHPHSLTFQNRLIQAKRMYALIARYKKSYPNYLLGRTVLMLRIAAFWLFNWIPMQKSLVYAIQKAYKKY